MGNDTTGASGRFVLRIDSKLHARLRDEAAAAGMSLNELCARRLAHPGSAVAGELLARAAARYGSALRAVVLFGSWARGSAGADSDVDALLVVDRGVPLTRTLYTAWDVEPLMLEGRQVEVHVAHLPEQPAALSGLWCELALEGLVLYDRDLSTSRYLASVRLRIVAGEVTRRVAHGQPYWTGVA